MPIRHFDREHYEPKVYQRAEELLSLEGEPPTAAAIARILLEEFPGERKGDPGREGRARAPVERTVRSWIASGRVTRRTDIWGLGDGSPEDARLVVETIAALEAAGQRGTMYRDQAEWLARFRRMFPELEPVDAYSIVVLAIAVDAGRAGTITRADLIRGLAFAPWRDDGAGYLEAFASGQIGSYLMELPGARPAEEAKAAKRAARDKEVRDART